MSKPSSSFLDLNNAKSNIEAAKNRAEKKDGIEPGDLLITDPAGRPVREKTKSLKRKSEAQRMASGEAQKRMIAIDNEVFKAMKQEQIERFNEKLTLSEIIDEALRTRYNL